MTTNRVERDGYDPHIVPAETAARIEREGKDYKHMPDDEADADAADSIDTAGGYTVDQEGLANNYAIEPEMYYEERGDLKVKEDAEKAERKQELKEINEPGGKGPGII